MQGSGEIVAIDLDDSVLETAKLALQDVVGTKVSVRKSNVYELPFKDNSFDVVHAHQVFQHLTDPIGALKEMKRVCRGHICLREVSSDKNKWERHINLQVDYESWFFSPKDTRLEAWKQAYREVCFQNGANPDCGRSLRGYLNKVELEDHSLGGVVTMYSSPEEKQVWAKTWTERSTTTKLAKQFLDYEIAEDEEIREFGQAWTEWGNLVDSMMYYVDVYAVVKV